MQMSDSVTVCWLLLDLDDTLADTQGACWRASVAAARELGLPVPTERAFYDVYGRRHFCDCVAIWCGPGHFTAFNRVYLRQVRYTAIGDVCGLLDRVTRIGLRVGLVTNSSRREADRKLRDADVPAKHLQFVATPTDQPARKPSKSAFSSVLANHKIDPATAVYISDDPADGRGARAAGMTFLAVCTGIATAADFHAAGTPRRHTFATVHGAVESLLPAARATPTCGEPHP
jgi:phosphoglycolate phosphatase-like HAD superfamily hydrolase